MGGDHYCEDGASQEEAEVQDKTENEVERKSYFNTKIQLPTYSYHIALFVQILSIPLLNLPTFYSMGLWVEPGPWGNVS